MGRLLPRAKCSAVSKQRQRRRDVSAWAHRKPRKRQTSLYVMQSAHLRPRNGISARYRRRRKRRSSSNVNADGMRYQKVEEFSFEQISRDKNGNVGSSLLQMCIERGEEYDK